jgi:NAD+ synthase (glutamine-hydrolysing)
VPFGDCVVSTVDTCIGVELCEELFTPERCDCVYGERGCARFSFVFSCL